MWDSWKWSNLSIQLIIQLENDSGGSEGSRKKCVKMITGIFGNIYAHFR